MNRAQVSTIISFFWVIAALIGVVFGAYYLRNILMLLFLSFIFASALHPGVKFGKQLKVPAAISMVVMYIFIFLFLALLLSFIIPPFIQQTTQFATVASQMIGFQEIHFDGAWSLDLREVASSYREYGTLLNQFTGSLQAILSVITSTFSVLFVFVTWLVMTSHILLSLEHFALSFAWLLPGSTSEEKVKKSHDLLEKIMTQLGSWVRGELVLMFSIGIGTYIGLVLLGVPFALPLAIIAGVLEIVPNLGPTLSAVPAVIAAFLLVNPITGVATILFYILIQLIENSFLVPQIMREAVDVHPLTTLILMLVGFQVMGAVGAIGILPLYIMVRTISRELYPGKGPFANLSAKVKKEK